MCPNTKENKGWSKVKWKPVYMNLSVWGWRESGGRGGEICRGEWYYILNRMPSTTFCKVSQPISLAQNPGRPCLFHHFYVLIKYVHINFVWNINAINFCLCAPRKVHLKRFSFSHFECTFTAASLSSQNI